MSCVGAHFFVFAIASNIVLGISALYLWLRYPQKCKDLIAFIRELDR